MAREPYSPVPGVEPTGPAGQNLQIQANPSEFGALPAQGLEKLGAGAEQAGSNLYQAVQQTQELTNETNARDRNTAYMQDIASKSAKFFSLAGKDAVAAQPAFAADIADTQKKYAQGLNPQALNYYNQASAYLMSRLTMSSASHAGSQSIQWQAQSHAANAESVAQMGVLTPNDPHLVDTAANSLADSVEGEIRARDSQADPAAIKTAQQKALGRYYLQVIQRQVDSNNIPGALQTFDRAQSRMDPGSITQADSYLRAKRDENSLAAFGQRHSLIQPDVQPAQQGITPTRIQDALRGTEGSGPTAVNQRTGASGSNQIIQSTFNEYKMGNESYANEDDRNRAASRYIDDMYKKTGGDAARIAVGYFSGTGNIAPPGSPTPWINNTNDGNLTVQQYVNNTQGNLHTPASTYADEYSRILHATADAQHQFPGNAVMQRQAVNMVRDQIAQENAMLRLTDAANDKQRKDQAQAAGDSIFHEATTNPGPHVLQMIDQSPMPWQQKLELKNAVARGDGSQKGMGDGFVDLFKAVHADPTDPNRITDEGQLYGHLGYDLTYQGMTALRKELNGGDKDVAKMKEAGLDYGKSKLMQYPQDADGKALYDSGYVPAFLKAYNDGIAAKKTPQQLLSKDSPDFIGDKVVKALRPDPNADMQKLLSPGAAAAKPEAALDLKSQGGIVAAYQSGKIDRDKASKLLIDAGFARAQPVAPLAPALPGDTGR